VRAGLSLFLLTIAATAGEWAGSAACSDCHPRIHAHWKGTAHRNTLRDFAPGVPARPFDGEIFLARDIEHRLGPGPFMVAEGPGGVMRRFEVDLVIGLRRIQMFTTRMAGGRIQVLPVFLEVPKRRWFDYTDFLFGGPIDLEVPPDSPDSWYTYARNFNSRCGGCHTTNYDVGYDPDRGTYETTWNERSVSCESCHGPSAAHVAYWRSGDKHGDDPVLNPVKLPVERANQICGQCHAEGERVLPGYRPGDDLFAFVDAAGLEDERHLAADGRATELIHNLVPTMESRCGPIACTKCHDPHGRGIPGDLYRPVDDDRTCTQCHEGADHSHHPPDSPGSRCVACHMPRMVIEGGHGRSFDHTMSVPSMRNTKELGLPNACRDCHLLEDPGWEYEPFERWYPGAEERNHRVALARTIAAARTGRDGAREPLLELLRDENPVYRAGAARYLARYDVDLRPQLADPHPMVRRAAIEGVAGEHPEALVRLLDDENHVLRYRAALALLLKPGGLRGRPDLRDRVLAALEPFARLRPDRDVNHLALARLYEQAGRVPEAVRSYERYLRLASWDERTRAHLGRLR
jgi:predicted CXXCH cytochrome family protein